MSDIERDQRAFARERITVNGTVKSLDAEIYEDEASLGTTKHMRAKTAKIINEGSANLYLDENGGDPSASRGVTLVPGQSHIVRGLEGMRKIRMTRTSSTDTSVEVAYYR